jgi:hypothetical protein
MFKNHVSHKYIRNLTKTSKYNDDEILTEFVDRMFIAYSY